MEKEFVPYKLALIMRQLGFDEPCFATYRKGAIASKKPFEYDLDYHTKVQMQSSVIPINSEYIEESGWISAPLYQQAFEWILKKYKLHSFVDIYPTTDEPERCWFMIRYIEKDEIEKEDYMSGWFNNQNDIKTPRLRKLLEIIEQKNN